MKDRKPRSSGKTAKPTAKARPARASRPVREGAPKNAQTPARRREVDVVEASARTGFDPFASLSLRVRTPRGAAPTTNHDDDRDAERDDEREGGRADPRSERLQKALARAGVASRRAAEQMIVEGRVRVNDVVIKELGSKIDPTRDIVRVDGRTIQIAAPDQQEKVYFLLNKPAGYLTTTRDDRGRKTVMDLVTGASLARIYPVGRLDYDAEGALLLTNDGELANLLTHPRYHVPKTYMAKVKGKPEEAQLDKLRRGIYLEDGPTKPAHVEVAGKAKINTWVEITVTEGRNRLIKRMFWRIQHPVMKLVRTKFGALDTDGLRLGEYRELTRRELQALRELIA